MPDSLTAFNNWMSREDAMDEIRCFNLDDPYPDFFDYYPEGKIITMKDGRQFRKHGYTWERMNAEEAEAASQA